MEIIVRSVLGNIDTIDKNVNHWVTLANLANEFRKANKEDTLIFNFKGINIIEPWKKPEFIKFIAIKNIKIKIINYPEVVSGLRIAMSLHGIDSGKILEENNIIKSDKKPDYNVQVYHKLMAMAKIDSQTLIIEYCKLSQQLTKPITANSIAKVIEDVTSSNDIKYVTVDFTGVSIDNKITRETLFNYALKADIPIEIVGLAGEDAEIYNIQYTLKLSGMSSLTASKKVEHIVNSLQLDTIVMLATYVKDKQDQFGRYGGGRVLKNEYAKFKGVDGTSLIFEVYLYDKFNTIERCIHHFYEDESNDDVEIELGLTTTIISKDISYFGFMNDFIGLEHHINRLIQYDKEFRIDMEISKDTKVGLNTTQIDITRLKIIPVTIPEFAKYVLEQYEEEYNVKELEYDLAMTMAEIGQ